jgi:hypothetical protein
VLELDWDLAKKLSDKDLAKPLCMSSIQFFTPVKVGNRIDIY